MRAVDIDTAAARRGYLVGVCAEDEWSHARTLRIVHGPDGSAIYVREASRAASDMGPMALMRVAAPDEWVRYEPEDERRYLLAQHSRRILYDSAEGWRRASRQLPLDWHEDCGREGRD